MKKKIGQSGFTLLEVIVSLILVGIMTAVAGLGIVQATRAFIFTKEATVIGQKGDLAMTRLRRAVQNLTAVVGTPSATSLTIRRLEKGSDVTETYTLTGNNLMLTDSGGTNTAQILSDMVQTLTFTYRQADGTVWSPSYNDSSDLATVDVSMTLRGTGGSSVTYADKVVPRNTYISGGRAYTPSGMTSGGFSCFVATVAYGNGDYPSVKVLRQFRDRYLLTSSWGKSFVRWYYRNGPDLAAAFKSSSVSRFLVRLALLPLVGIAFLVLYFPAGILLMTLIAWILARLFMQTGVFHRMAAKASLLASPGGAKGSILIGLIVTMVIMAALMGAMVSMYSAANAASVPAYFAQKAYYLAESGRNYAIKNFLANRNNDSAFISNVHNRTFPVTSSNDTFKVLIKSFYYNYGGSGGSNTTSVTVSPFGQLPDFASGIPTGPQGVIQVGTTTPIGFSNVTYNSSAQTLTFTVPSAVIGSGLVRPGVRLNGAQTIQAKNYGESLGDNLTINIGPNNQGAFMLPSVNGAMSFKTLTGDEWHFIYDRIVTVSGDRLLKGIRNFPGKKALPTAGISLASNTPLILGRYAQFASTGTVGTGVMAASQTIKQNQPLEAVEVFTMASGAMNPLEAVLGNFSQVTQDGGPATKITQTVQTYSYVGSTPTYMQESFQAVQWSSPNPLQQLWNQSNQILSYDLQAKIKFTETEDDTTTSPVNFPGNYMPGITFRVKCTTGSSKDCTYYGVSFMRGVQGRMEHDSGGCGDEYYTEEDDISDNLFEEFESNSSAHPNASDISCTGTDRFIPNTWNSTNSTQSYTWNAAVNLTGGAALDGIPYLIFWQKDWSQTTGICGGTTSPWDWLTFMPLVEAKFTQVYYYPANTSTGRPAGWYEANLTDGTPPFGSVTGRLGPFTVWKLRDKYGVLKTSSQEGRTILGMPGTDTATGTTVLVRDTAFLPVNKWDNTTEAAVGFILPNIKDSTYSSYSTANYRYLKASRNYRIYPKPWVTIVGRIIEMSGDFDCNASNGDERVNAVMAYVADPNGISGTYGASAKDAVRQAYTRNLNYPATTSYTVRWPDVDDYFTMAVWGQGNYSSKSVRMPSTTCGWINVDVKIVEKGTDSDGDYVTAYTAFLTTLTSPSYFGSEYEYPEFGYHTAGISAPSTCTGSHCETVYFTDGYWQAYRGGNLGVLPGIQEQ